MKCFKLILSVISLYASKCASLQLSHSTKKFQTHKRSLNMAAEVSSSNVNKPGLPPWVPTFGTAALGGLLFGSDIGKS